MTSIELISSEEEMTLRGDILAQPPTFVDNFIQGSPNAVPLGSPGGHFGNVFQIEGASPHGGPVGYKTPIYGAAMSGGRGDHIYGANFCATKMPGHPNSLVIGAEFNVNNWGDTDVNPGEWPLMAAVSVYSAGTHLSRAGYWMDSASPTGRVRNAVELPRTGYVDAAIRAGSPSHTRQGTLVIGQGGLSDAIVVECANSYGTLYRAVDEDGENLFIVWHDGSQYNKGPVYSGGYRLVREDEFNALKARVAALEAR